MNKTFNLPVMIFFLLGLCLTAFAQDKPVDRNDASQLREIYREFDRAGKTGDDIKVIEKYLDENYELQDGETKMNRAQVIEQVKLFKLSVGKITESSSKIEKIRVADGKYFLEVTAIIKGTLKMADGTTAPFDSVSKSTDVWLKTAAGWREILQIGNEKKFVLNGQEIPL